MTVAIHPPIPIVRSFRHLPVFTLKSLKSRAISPIERVRAVITVRSKSVPNPPTINTSKKTHFNPPLINTYKIAGLKVPQNQHLQKNGGWGPSLYWFSRSSPVRYINRRCMTQWRGEFQGFERHDRCP